MKIMLVPKYLSEFKCIGPDCEDSCCVGWKVTIDKKMFNKYRNKVQHSEMKLKLQENIKKNRQLHNEESYGQFVMDDDSRCTMLQDDGLCSIHKNLGEEFLCNTCAIYPRNYTRVDGVLENSLSLSCPEAARLVLLKKEGIDFIEEIENNNDRILIMREIQSAKASHFWELRFFTIGLLQNRTQPIEIRLILLGMFLQKINELPKKQWDVEFDTIAQEYMNGLTNDGFIASLKNIQGNHAFKLNLVRDLIRYRLSGTVSSSKYVAILQDVLEGLMLEEDENKEVKDFDESLMKYNATVLKYRNEYSADLECIFENYCVNHVFRTLFPMDHKTFFKSFVTLTIQFTLIQIHLIGLLAKHGELTVETVLLCIQQISKVIEHDYSYLQGTLAALEESNYTTMAHMFVLLKD